MIPRRASAALGLLSILTTLLAAPVVGGTASAAAPEKKPKVSIGDVTVTETDAAGVVATFDVTLKKGVGEKVKVSWATEPGSASTADFTAASGKVVFKGPKKKQTKQVQVAITGDNVVEPDETFRVVLTKVKGAKAKKATGTATIANDDADHTLTVAPAGNGAGTVTSSPAGISCPGDCAEAYASGTAVTLTAVPAASSDFTGWSGAGCSGTGTCVTTVNAGATVVPTFALKTFTLTVNKSGNGTVSGTGISCGVDCSEDYTYGTMVTLTAAAATNNVFTGWSGGGCSGTGTCTVTMTAANTVNATFAPSFLLTVTKAGNGGGTVTSTPPGISCGVDCTEEYATGTMVTLTPAPSTGSTFTGWSGGCTGAGACTVTMSQARSVQATFTLQQFTLSVGIQQNGGSDGRVTGPGISCGVGTPGDCTEIYNYGTAVHLTASAGSGFTPVGWTGACDGQAPASCNITVTAATSTTAIFNSL